VQTIAGKGGAGVAGGSTTQVQYNSSGSLAGSANMTFDGTKLTLANDASISGLTVGKGGGSVSTNTVVGNLAQVSTNTGGLTVAIGYSAGNAITSGDSNNFIGAYAGRVTTTATGNVGVGTSVLYDNTTGSSNIAIGQQALRYNTTASNNTAVGYQAGYSAVTSTSNVFVGAQAGYSVTATGDNRNTFVGPYAGYFVTSGTKNTIIGGFNGLNNGPDIRTASNYIVLSDGDGNARAWFRGSDGLMFCPPMYAVTSGNSANVVVNPDGGVLRSTSALKYKQDIRDLPSIDINKFRPVVYKSKCEGDDQTKDHFGFIADEVDEAGIKELVQYGAENEIEGFSYDRMTAVLVKAIQELKAEVDSLKKQLGK
jgi:hypothetical protein